jgi:hypothetical protein
MKSTKRESVLMVFVDGLGIADSKNSNPLKMIPNLSPIAYFKDDVADIYGDGVLNATDACLGVDGRPQSATGQTTIYTGINASQLLGRHLPGFPNKQLRDSISEKSIFKQLDDLGIGPNIFANTYTPEFFEKTPRWKSATTCCVEAADLNFCRLSDLLGRKSVFHDFTNEYLIEKGYDVPRFSPQEAGQILAELAERHRFVLYEHFITDKIGHAQDFKKAALHLPKLAELVRTVVDSIDNSRTTLILTSDHGNIEDLSIRNHTRNNVPTVVWGKHKESFSDRIQSLADITPAIIDLLI